MRKLFSVFSALILIAILQGCATSNYSYGRDFNSTNISSIVKGKTTTAELEQLLGKPFSKSVISETDEKWLYVHAAGTAKAQSFIVTVKVESTGQQRMLDVLVRNGIVVNYTYTEGGGTNDIWHNSRSVISYSVAHARPCLSTSA